MADNILASAISHIPHLSAFDEVAAFRLGDNFDVTPMLVYSIDTVPAGVLIFLAQQFDLMGAAGWALAETEAEQRALIKSAIELHRFKGTVWSVKEAVKRVGYPNVEIVEHVSVDGVNYDGQYLYDDTQTYGGGFWADFRVKIVVPDNKALGPYDKARIVQMVLEYKNVRSRLIDVTFVLTFADTLAPDDTLDFYQDPLSDPDAMTPGIYYSGASLYDGAQVHNKGNDPLTLLIYQNGDLLSTETI